MKIRTLATLVMAGWLLIPAGASSQNKVDIGFWTQAWYQYVDNGVSDHPTKDFSVRRAYLSVKAQPTDYLSFFTHIAVDRFGQEGLDNPSLGLGSGLTFRDLWITLTLSESFKIQAGRMYVPLTRNYGTTSTKALLTTDISYLQGGIRGGIFYASKVGRDDGITLWGNPFNGVLQYRLMVAEGVEGNNNPEDNYRITGRAVLNLLEPEKEWFNQGTYLGQKKVLSLGLAFDSQKNLTLNNKTGQDNTTLTADLFFDHPLGGGGITIETAYVSAKNLTQPIPVVQLPAGEEADLCYLQAGYFIGKKTGPGNLQPYFRYERLKPEEREMAKFFSGGFNYYLKGHNAKVSADYTLITQDGMSDQQMFTVQLAVGI